MNMLRSGKFWMMFWLVILVIFVIWGVLTILFWRNSVANLNALSIAALLVAVGAGVQSTLAMRKADEHDEF